MRFDVYIEPDRLARELIDEPEFTISVIAELSSIDKAAERIAAGFTGSAFHEPAAAFLRRLADAIDGVK